MNIIEIFVVIAIIVAFIFAYFKHTEYKRKIQNSSMNRAIKQKLMTQLGILNGALVGIILFYSYNMIAGLGLLPPYFLSGNAAALGAFISFLIYFVVRMRLQKQMGNTNAMLW